MQYGEILRLRVAVLAQLKEGTLFLSATGAKFTLVEFLFKTPLYHKTPHLSDPMHYCVPYNAVVGIY